MSTTTPLTGRAASERLGVLLAFGLLLGCILGFGLGGVMSLIGVVGISVPLGLRAHDRT